MTTCLQTVRDPRWNSAFMGDYTAYPSDVWEYLVEFCVLWNFSAPHFSRKSKEGSRAVMWLNALREMQEVCAEFGLEALRDYHKEFERYMQEHDGLAPHIVVSPKSLINFLAGHVAMMRTRPQKEEKKNITLSDWIGEIEKQEIDLREIPQATLERVTHGICTECEAEGNCIPIKGGMLCLEHYKLWRIEKLGLDR